MLFISHQVCKAHSGILGKGLALSHSPTILEALEGNLPLHLQTNEHSFLEDFITCVPNSSGGRLARYMQTNVQTKQQSNVILMFNVQQSSKKSSLDLVCQFNIVLPNYQCAFVTFLSFNPDGCSQTLMQTPRRHLWSWTKMTFAVDGRLLWLCRPKTSMEMWFMFPTWR